MSHAVLSPLTAAEQRLKGLYNDVNLGAAL